MASACQPKLPRGPAKAVKVDRAAGIGLPRHSQQAGEVGTTFLLRTASVSSAPTEISHTASAAMLGQSRRLQLRR